MALEIRTEDPQSLLISMKEDAKKGSLPHWLNSSGFDFTYLSSGMQAKAWMCGIVVERTAFFTILGPKGLENSQEIYALYHSEFIKMLLTYYKGRFQSINILLDDANSLSETI